MAVTVSEINAIYPNSAADRPLSRSVIALPKNVTPHGPAAAETLKFEGRYSYTCLVIVGS